jgi:2-oxoglutarate ferredoxin oxidoreductase subunit gamma
MSDTIKLICAGFGGQGVLTIGQMVAMMGLKKDYIVSWMPSYGPEMRGGTANAHVVISKKQQSPIISNDMTHLLAMNQLSSDKFYPRLVSNGWIVSHGALVKKKNITHEISLDFDAIAIAVNNIKTANMAAFGSLMVTLDMFDFQDGEIIIQEKFAHLDEVFLKQNIEAYYRGIEAAQSTILP